MLKPWLPKPEISDFTPLLLEWFVLNGRTNLPWQNPRTPYAVWISEIMLQQTQVKTVIPYFLRFMARFPDIQTLAQASEDDVLAHWSGLGYYSRGRRLHQTAQRLLNDFDATLPMDLNALISLPGIGASTAAAIASLAYNQPTAILDGNVKRVLSRFFMVDGSPQKASTHKTLKTWADLCMPSAQCADYTQAIMDLGATVCTPKNPACHACPLQQGCKAHQQDLTEHYPQKAEKKALPHKTQLFPLIHTADQKIYLEKRPSKGLWGGLWCLPWLDIDACAKQYASATLGLLVEDALPLLNLKHTFTHFHLHVHACTLKVIQPLNKNIQGSFFDLQQMKHLGIAKPTRQLIDCFLSSRADDLMTHEARFCLSVAS